MCSIMGYCGSGAVFKAFKKGFDRTISRGRTTAVLLIQGKDFSGFIVFPLWG